MLLGEILFWLIMVEAISLIVWFRYLDSHKASCFFAIECTILCIVIVVTSVVFLFRSPIEPKQVEEQYRELVSIKDGTRKESYGFLTMYSNSERDVYSYYYMTENGGYKRETIEDYNVTIFEEDNCTPRITKVTITYFYQYGFLGIKWNEIERTEEEYNIYVPKGSIVREFELDAE